MPSPTTTNVVIDAAPHAGGAIVDVTPVVGPDGAAADAVVGETTEGIPAADVDITAAIANDIVGP